MQDPYEIPRTHPRTPGNPAHAQSGWVRSLQEGAPGWARRFFAVRPELEREEGRLGVALVLAWVAEIGERSGGLSSRHGGELCWDHLAGFTLPRGQVAGVVVDAAVGFLGFLGSVGVLPPAHAARLRQQARVEGLAYLAFTMGLLSPAEAAARRRRYAR